MKLAGFLLLSAWVLACTQARAADLVVIDLKNRTADELLPALRPMVGPDVALSGLDYKLLVRGSPAEVAKIRDVLTVVDRAPRQLLISVRYSGTPESKSSNFGAGSGSGGTQVTVRGGITTRTATDSNTSSVRVLEGNSAHISTGQSVPIVTAFVPAQISGRNNSVGISTDYRELSSGFTVLPRVNGERVILEVSAQQQQLVDTNSLRSTVQRASTTVSAKLGEWIDLGGVTSSSEEQRTSIGLAGGSRRVTTQSDQRSIAVKVEQVQ